MGDDLVMDDLGSNAGGAAEVITVIPLAGFDKELGYRLPPHMRGTVAVGSMVRVPVRHRQVLAVVSRLGSDGDFPASRMKLASQIATELPPLPTDLVAMARWMAHYYAAPLDAILETMIPPPIRRGMKEKVEHYLSAGDDLAPEELAALEKKAPKQAALYKLVKNQFRPQKKSVLLKRLGVNAASCAALVKKGLLREEARFVERTAYDDDFGGAEVTGRSTFSLNPEQVAAVESIGETMAAGKFTVHLLHGVTGSGKTEVYIDLLQRALAAGGSAIFLVPEVALTPQTVGRLRGRLEKESGHRTVVWHSHLSAGEKADAWRALASGEARVVVGARSAIFAPVRDLRLVVVDEEHEPAYKQEETPRYHGRDAAVYRAMLNDAVCVLGSATPSLESVRNVEGGRYRVNRLLKRVDDRELPTIHIVDMRMEMLSGKMVAPLSRFLAEKMQQRFESREQTILFLNRRGYSPSMICPDCGYVAGCDHCSIALTYHRFDETLKCHLCGHECAAPLGCPKCDSRKIRWRGSGTQRVEEALRRTLPRASIARIDADTMSKKNRFREILSDFRRGRIDVLVGTQMIAKGLDFPNVTLVGLVDADLSLHIPDFRASERTFQLLVQVSGRAGRGDRSGDVVVQTFSPHADPIQFARRGDFDGFIDAEMGNRREFNYPPFRHLIHHLFTGRNPEKVCFFAEQWVRHVEKTLGDQIEIRGPAPAPLEKVKDRYRFQAWYFCQSASRVIGPLQALREKFKWGDDVTQVIDVDPMNLC